MNSPNPNMLPTQLNHDQHQKITLLSYQNVMINNQNIKTRIKTKIKIKTNKIKIKVTYFKRDKSRDGCDV